MFHSPKYLVKKVAKNEEQNNMFMTQTLDETDFYKNGKICPYYIVGNPEIFRKKTILIKNQEQQSNPPTKPSQRVIRKHHVRKQDSDFIYEDMDASEVEQEVDRVIQSQKEQQPQVKMILTKPDQLYAEREGKIMAAFEDRQKQWNQRVVQSAKACGRDPKQSLFHHIDAARQKYEDRKLLDLIQSDHEKYGNKLWVLKVINQEMQLREDKEEVQKKNLNFEIVKKNKAEQVYQRPRGIQKKFDEKKEIIEKLIPSISVQEMEVVGQNKLVKESASLLNLAKKQKKTGFNPELPLSSKRKIILSAPFEKKKLKEEPLYYQQIVEINYNKKLLRQSGQLDICKQIF